MPLTGGNGSSGRLRAPPEGTARKPGFYGLYDILRNCRFQPSCLCYGLRDMTRSRRYGNLDCVQGQYRFRDTRRSFLQMARARYEERGTSCSAYVD